MINGRPEDFDGYIVLVHIKNDSSHDLVVDLYGHHEHHIPIYSMGNIYSCDGLPYEPMPDYFIFPYVTVTYDNEYTISYEEDSALIPQHLNLCYSTSYVFKWVDSVISTFTYTITDKDYEFAREYCANEE